LAIPIFHNISVYLTSFLYYFDDIVLTTKLI